MRAFGPWIWATKRFDAAYWKVAVMKINDLRKWRTLKILRLRREIYWYCYFWGTTSLWKSFEVLFTPLLAHGFWTFFINMLRIADKYTYRERNSFYLTLFWGTSDKVKISGLQNSEVVTTIRKSAYYLRWVCLRISLPGFHALWHSASLVSWISAESQNTWKKKQLT